MFTFHPKYSCLSPLHQPPSIPQGEVVALMNGLKSAPTLYQDWSDYRIKLDGDSDIDIPEVIQQMDGNICLA